MLLIFACSKKDDDEFDIDEEPTVENYLSINNANIKTYEVVSITVSDVNLNNSYQAKLGDLNVELNKIDETTLALFIPYLENGTYMLDSELGELELNITQTVLSKKKEEVITDFKTKIETNFTPTVGNPNSQGAKILNDIFNNTTEDEKQAIALFFEANKEIFNDILTTSFAKGAKSNAQLSDPFDLLITETKKFVRNVIKISVGVAAIAIGEEIVVGGVATGGLVSIAGALIGGAGAALIIDTFPQLKQNVYNILDISFNTEDFELNNGVSNKASKASSVTLAFTNKKSRTLSFTQTNATLSQSNSSSSNATIASFFETFSKFNSVINTINAAIDLANKIPFVNIDKVVAPTIPATSKKEELNIKTENYTNYSFSVNNYKVSSSTSLDDKGKLKITFTADDTVDFTNDLEFNFTIAFDDNLNSLSKTYAIKLKGEKENPILGEWKATSYNGKIMGELTTDNYNTKCNKYLNSYSVDASSLTISETSVFFDLNQTANNINYSSDADGVICSSIEIKPEEIYDSFNYEFKDFEKQGSTEVYILKTKNSDNAEVTITIESISQDKLKFIYQAKYDANDIDIITLMYDRK